MGAGSSGKGGGGGGSPISTAASLISYSTRVESEVAADRKTLDGLKAELGKIKNEDSSKDAEQQALKNEIARLEEKVDTYSAASEQAKSDAYKAMQDAQSAGGDNALDLIIDEVERNSEQAARDSARSSRNKPPPSGKVLADFKRDQRKERRNLDRSAQKTDKKLAKLDRKLHDGEISRADWIQKSAEADRAQADKDARRKHELDKNKTDREALERRSKGLIQPPLTPQERATLRGLIEEESSSKEEKAEIDARRAERRDRASERFKALRTERKRTDKVAESKQKRMSPEAFEAWQKEQHAKEEAQEVDRREELEHHEKTHPQSMTKEEKEELEWLRMRHQMRNPPPLGPVPKESISCDECKCTDPPCVWPETCVCEPPDAEDEEEEEKRKKEPDPSAGEPPTVEPPGTPPGPDSGGGGGGGGRGGGGLGDIHPGKGGGQVQPVVPPGTGLPPPVEPPPPIPPLMPASPPEQEEPDDSIGDPDYAQPHVSDPPKNPPLPPCDEGAEMTIPPKWAGVGVIEKQDDGWTIRVGDFLYKFEGLSKERDEQLTRLKAAPGGGTINVGGWKVRCLGDQRSFWAKADELLGLSRFLNVLGDSKLFQAITQSALSKIAYKLLTGQEVTDEDIAEAVIEMLVGLAMGPIGMAAGKKLGTYLGEKAGAVVRKILKLFGFKKDPEKVLAAAKGKIKAKFKGKVDADQIEEGFEKGNQRGFREGEYAQPEASAPASAPAAKPNGKPAGADQPAPGGPNLGAQADDVLKRQEPGQVANPTPPQAKSPPAAGEARVAAGGAPEPAKSPSVESPPASSAPPQGGRKKGARPKSEPKPPLTEAERLAKEAARKADKAARAKLRLNLLKEEARRELIKRGNPNPSAKDITRLANNKEFRKRFAGDEAHHLVQLNTDEGKAAQKILEKYEVPLNGKENGVLLSDAAHHNPVVHAKETRERLLTDLSAAESREDVVALLDEHRRMLQNLGN